MSTMIVDGKGVLSIPIQKVVAMLIRNGTLAAWKKSRGVK